MSTVTAPAAPEAGLSPGGLIHRYCVRCAPTVARRTRITKALCGRVRPPGPNRSKPDWQECVVCVDLLAMGAHTCPDDYEQEQE